MCGRGQGQPPVGGRPAGLKPGSYRPINRVSLACTKPHDPYSAHPPGSRRRHRPQGAGHPAHALSGSQRCTPGTGPGRHVDPSAAGAQAPAAAVSRQSSDSARLHLGHHAGRSRQLRAGRRAAGRGAAPEPLLRLQARARQGTSADSRPVSDGQPRHRCPGRAQRSGCMGLP